MKGDSLEKFLRYLGDLFAPRFDVVLMAVWLVGDVAFRYASVKSRLIGTLLFGLAQKD